MLLLTEGDVGTVVDIAAGGDMTNAPRFATGVEGPLDVCLGPGDEVYVLEGISNEVTIITGGGDFTSAPAFAFGWTETPSSLSCTNTEIRR